MNVTHSGPYLPRERSICIDITVSYSEDPYMNIWVSFILSIPNTTKIPHLMAENQGLHQYHLMVTALAPRQKLYIMKHVPSSFTHATFNFAEHSMIISD
jgi:hypothetical protein